MSDSNTDHKLDSIATNQFLWKSDSMRRVGIAIVESAMNSTTLWPDGVNFDWLPADDSGCVGNCYRLLMKTGILARTGQYRRSVSKASNGRTISEYKILSVAKAKTWLARNGKLTTPLEKQLDLLALPTNYPNN